MNYDWQAGKVKGAEGCRNVGVWFHIKPLGVSYFYMMPTTLCVSWYFHSAPTRAKAARFSQATGNNILSRWVIPLFSTLMSDCIISVVERASVWHLQPFKCSDFSTWKLWGRKACRGSVSWMYCSKVYSVFLNDSAPSALTETNSPGWGHKITHVVMFIFHLNVFRANTLW